MRLMKIGGLLKFSLIDYPQKMSAVIFTQGCNFRCSYCHNPELVLPQEFHTPLLEKDVLAFLEKRRHQLEGVVISGGEPTLQKDLIPFLRKIKKMGYAIKLDTNGSHPEVLQSVISQKLVDYIAMDIKSPLEKYHLFTQGNDYLAEIKSSIEMIRTSALDYEFRTTYVKSVLSEKDISKILEILKGDKAYHTQSFIPVTKNKYVFALHQ